VSLDVSQWAVLWGALLPLLVGLVTTKATNAGVKAVLLLALNGVAAVLDQFFAATGGGFDWKAAIVNAAAAFVIGTATHFGLWKPIGASSTLQDVGSGPGRHSAE